MTPGDIYFISTWKQVGIYVLVLKDNGKNNGSYIAQWDDGFISAAFSMVIWPEAVQVELTELQKLLIFTKVILKPADKYLR